MSCLFCDFVSWSWWSENTPTDSDDRVWTSEITQPLLLLDRICPFYLCGSTGGNVDRKKLDGEERGVGGGMVVCVGGGGGGSSHCSCLAICSSRVHDVLNIR